MSKPQSHRLIQLTVNGQAICREIEARMTLADFLRHELGLTGTHVGCEHGVCGACTVQVDGNAVRSCIMYAVQVDAAVVRTVEDLADGDSLHPLQRAFGEHGALQCGFCTPGFLMTADDLLRRKPAATELEIRDALAGSICRCTGYQPIVEAVLSMTDEVRMQRDCD